jgi:hypothetical protein
MKLALFIILLTAFLFGFILPCFDEPPAPRPADEADPIGYGGL